MGVGSSQTWCINFSVVQIFNGSPIANTFLVALEKSNVSLLSRQKNPVMESTFLGRVVKSNGGESQF